MTPAVSETRNESAYFIGKWYYGGTYYPNGNTNEKMFTLGYHRYRPQSIGGGKVAGLWPLKPWSHQWANYTPDYKSWSASAKTSPLSVHVYEGAPFFGTDVLEQGAAQVAPYLKSGLFPVNLESQARTEFLEKLQGSKWELGEALAEVKETAGFLRDGTNSLADLLRRAGSKIGRRTSKVAEMLSEGAMDIMLTHQAGVVVRGQSHKQQAKVANKARKQLAGKYGMRPVTNLADMWLGYQFGVKPLLSDLASATVHLNETLFQTVEGQGMRMRLSVTKEMVETERSNHSTSSPVRRGAGYIDWDVRSVVTIVGDYRTDSRQLRANQQLGLTSQLGLAYAVMPYSWMIDYFLQFGPWLNGLDAGLGLTPLGASVSRTQWVKPMKFTPYSSAMKFDGISPWTAKGNVENDPMAMRMVRTSEPMVYPGFPPLGEILNVSQALSSLAALTKLLR